MRMVESIGGTVESCHFALGGHDMFVIGNLPDDVAAAALRHSHGCGRCSTLGVDHTAHAGADRRGSQATDRLPRAGQMTTEGIDPGSSRVAPAVTETTKTPDLGTYGIWRGAAGLPPELGTAIEKLGFGTIWIGGSPRADLRIAGETSRRDRAHHRGNRNRQHLVLPCGCGGGVLSPTRSRAPGAIPARRRRRTPGGDRRLHQARTPHSCRTSTNSTRPRSRKRGASSPHWGRRC